VAASLPPVGVRIVKDLDKVSATEAQLSLLLGIKIKEGLNVCWLLKGERKTYTK